MTSTPSLNELRIGDDPDRFLTGIFANLIFWASLEHLVQNKDPSQDVLCFLPSRTFDVVFALIAQIATVIFVVLLPPPSSP